MIHSHPLVWKALFLTIAGSVTLAALIAEQNVYIPLWIAVVMAASAIITPLSVEAFRVRSRRIEKRLDWEREDKVAKLLLASTQAAAGHAEESAIKITKIEGMVDGQMTVHMESDLESKIISLQLLKEITELKRTDRDISPSPKTLEAISSMETSIKDLRKSIEARKATANKVGL